MRMGKKLKILVVDDSVFMRRVISDVINSDSRFVVVGEAANGEEGLDMIAKLRPDAVTLDLQMPVMDGLTMLSRLKKGNRPPVVVLSSLARHDEDVTIEALEKGAFDFVVKPDRMMKIKSEELKKELTGKLSAAVTSGSSMKQNGWFKDEDYDLHITRKPDLTSTERIQKLIAIGASTGGPRTLRHILSEMPADLDAAIVIVQHMPAGFTRSFADRLDESCLLKVKEAEPGDVLKSGHVYIAPGDRHLLVLEQGNGKYEIALNNGPSVSGHKPSVDVMMMSLAELRIKTIVGVILTGMGSDGAKGVKLLKDKRQAHMIAQNKESCVVYGMPKSIVEKGLANEIVDIKRLRDSIVNKLGVD